MQSRRCCWNESFDSRHCYDTCRKLCQHDAHGYATQCDRICKWSYKDQRNDEGGVCNKSCCHCFDITVLLVLITIVDKSVNYQRWYLVRYLFYNISCLHSLRIYGRFQNCCFFNGYPDQPDGDR